MKLKSIHIAVITIIVIFGGILSTSLIGLWKTTNDKVPAIYKDGEFKGQYNPADIRGSYTFFDISNTFNIPIEDLGKAFDLKDPNKYSLFQCKELETLYAALASEGVEVGTGSVRYFVALYKGLPIEVNEDTYLPDTAVDILKEKASLTKEQIEYLENHSVTLPKDSQANVVQPSSTQESTQKVIKGNTTFKDLLDWGVKKEDIEKVINDKVPNAGIVIKDYAVSKGIEFIVLKNPLQELIDSLNK